MEVSMYKHTILPGYDEVIYIIMDSKPKGEDDKPKNNSRRNIDQAMHAQIYPSYRKEGNGFVNTEKHDKPIVFLKFACPLIVQFLALFYGDHKYDRHTDISRNRHKQT